MSRFTAFMENCPPLTMKLLLLALAALMPTYRLATFVTVPPLIVTELLVAPDAEPTVMLLLSRFHVVPASTVTLLLDVPLAPKVRPALQRLALVVIMVLRPSLLPTVIRLLETVTIPAPPPTR